ncbi:MAG: tetratricopeptide repeat protein [Candidatus Aureabacteria bacterium]|nr:tetratricopeptide repeat protein [Candidatus Auribacterota bacterium]
MNANLYNINNLTNISFILKVLQTIALISFFTYKKVLTGLFNSLIKAPSLFSKYMLSRNMTPLSKIVIYIFLFFITLLCPSTNFAEEYRYITIKPQNPKANDSGSSRSLTLKAWKMLEAKNFTQAIKLTDKCISIFNNQAKQQQKSLTYYPSETANSYWALNDVATCFFIKGKSLLNIDKDDEAKEIFLMIIKNYGFSQCWEPELNIFWKVADAAKDQLIEMEKGVVFGNYSSVSLTSKAWNTFNKQDYISTLIYVNKCIGLYEPTALEQQKNIDPSKKLNDDEIFIKWALNDVAVCYFLKASSLLKMDEKERSNQYFQYIISTFPNAMCWDPRQGFWNVGKAAADHIFSEKADVNFEDYKSVNLTTNAWKALENNDMNKLKIYTNKCISLYEKKAKEQQRSLLTTSSLKEESPHAFWALNDVAACYFILAKNLYNQGEFKEAKNAFSKIIMNFPDAKCWDPRGWFWSIKEASEDQLLVMTSGIDFGDYTSLTLTTKAWQSYEMGDLPAAIIFTKKCISIYEKDAKEQQASLSNFAPFDSAFNYWALNDVATCYFILGEVLLEQKKYNESITIFSKITKEYPFAQCWDSKGWFWKISKGAQSRTIKIYSIIEEEKKLKKIAVNENINE